MTRRKPIARIFGCVSFGGDGRRVGAWVGGRWGVHTKERTMMVFRPAMIEARAAKRRGGGGSVEGWTPGVVVRAVALWVGFKSGSGLSGALGRLCACGRFREIWVKLVCVEGSWMLCSCSRDCREHIG